MQHLDLSKPIEITYPIYNDNRGSLEINFIDGEFMPFQPKQMLTANCHRYVLKGLHLNYDLAKMIRVLSGGILDIAVNFNVGDDQLKIYTFMLTQEDGWVYIPRGYGHGMLFFTESKVEYLLSEPYKDVNCKNIRLIDPLLQYEDSLQKEFQNNSHRYIMSEKDKRAIGVQEWLSQ